MESSRGKTRDEWRIIEIVGMAVTIMSGIAAIMSLRDKLQIVMTGVIGGVVLSVIALLAFRRNDRAIGSTVAIVAAVVLLATATYGLLVDTSKAEADTRKPAITTTTSPPEAVPETQSSEPAPQTQSEPTPSTNKKQPVFKGTAKLAAGQAIDLEEANPEPKPASGLESPADILIDSLSFVYDQGGYLMRYTGDPGDGEKEKGCRELLADGTSRAPVAPLPFTHYCVLTSENRVGLVQFTLSTTTYRVGGISYQVWDQ